MKPERVGPATLNDVLDRLLTKGVVVQADLIICLAGVPLIGVNLRAAVAGMETMLEYGLMRDWDEAARAWESTRRQEPQAPVDTIAAGLEI